MICLLLGRSNKVKNLAILIPTLSIGGAERVAANLSIGLSRYYNVFIIVYNRTENEYAHNDNIICLESKFYKGVLGKAYGFFKKIFQIRKIKKEYNIDISLSLLDMPSILNILSRYRDKVIVSVRNYKSREVNGITGKIDKMMISTFYNKADLVIACSELIKEDMIENFNVKREKIITIYNPYNIEDIKEKCKEEISDYDVNNKKFIVNVGRLTNQKGQDHLLRAFKIVKQSIADINLVIVGVGELEESLKKLAIDLGIFDSVFFVGFEKNPFKFIDKSEVYVLSSLFEGFPNTMLEAMICGAPIVSTDCKSGPREILCDIYDKNKVYNKFTEADYGIITPDFVESNNIESCEKELAEAIILLLKNDELKKHYSKKSKSRGDEFSLSSISDKYYSELEKL
nr:glycosyltransferase [Clostridium paraputrificum]